jgi:hypothetical protein
VPRTLALREEYLGEQRVRSMNQFSVHRTSTPRWAGEHGRKTIFVLGGAVDHAAIALLRGEAEAEALDSVDRVVLDVRAVVACDREGLVGLARLRGRLGSHPDCVVDVVGARWAQFVDALGREGHEGLDALQTVIRELRRPLTIDPHRARVHRSPAPPVVAHVTVRRSAVEPPGTREGISPEMPARPTAVAESCGGEGR